MFHFRETSLFELTSAFRDDVVLFDATIRHIASRQNRPRIAMRIVMRIVMRIGRQIYTEMAPTGVHLVGQFVRNVDRNVPHIVGQCRARTPAGYEPKRRSRSA